MVRTLHHASLSLLSPAALAEPCCRGRMLRPGFPAAHYCRGLAAGFGVPTPRQLSYESRVCSGECIKRAQAKRPASTCSVVPKLVQQSDYELVGEETFTLQQNQRVQMPAQECRK